MKVTRMVKVEITFPCSQEDWEQLCKLHMQSQQTPILTGNAGERGAAFERMETPVLDAMREAGLGKINLSALVRDMVSESPGILFDDVIAAVLEKHPDRFCTSQVYQCLYQQIYRYNITKHGKNLYPRNSTGESE